MPDTVRCVLRHTLEHKAVARSHDRLNWAEEPYELCAFQAKPIYDYTYDA